MDTTVIGETAAEAMERLAEEFGDGVEPVAVGIVVIADVGDRNVTRVYSNRDRYFEQLGLFMEALEAIRATAVDDDDDTGD